YLPSSRSLSTAPTHSHSVRSSYLPAKCPVEVGPARDPDISIVILFETGDFIEANSVERGNGFDGTVRIIDQHPRRGIRLYEVTRSEEHTSELQSRVDHVCLLLLTE